MDELSIKETIVETGKLLLEKKLVARTWGNISARIDEAHFAITPSGLGYEDLTAEDIPIFNKEDKTWIGTKKPSSEKKIHAACYTEYKDVNFVIHTHQDYATAIGLVDAESLYNFMSDDEKKLLGKITIAKYGLPGTKGLKKAVESALKTGSKVVLMIHHGTVICGADKEDAIHKAEVLETVCKKAFEAKCGTVSIESSYNNDTDLLKEIRKIYPNAVLCNSEIMMKLCETGSFNAQTDDMAQMLGGTLRCVDSDSNKVLKVLSKQDAVLVKGSGCIIKAEDIDDIGALELLISKAGLAKLYTKACNKKIKLSGFDCWLMRTVYKNKYSKKKNQNKNPDSGENSQTDKTSRRKELLRVIKFVGFSISAGVIEIVAFTLFNEIAHLPYWISYLVALILSVLWNFTFNRKFTFQAANNIPVAMIKVAVFYAIFTPLTTLLEHKLTAIGWNEYLVTLINMGINLTTEYLYDRYFVFRESLDTNSRVKK